MWRGVGRRLGRWLEPGPEPAAGAPTMIIPSGAVIERDDLGRLCVRAPGNLVLQSSGSYGELESVAGSIRIEAGVRIEATLVRCAGVCSVAGTLQAWRIVARELEVEAEAQAAFVLRDTRVLTVDPKGRVVGNFSSEGELVGLFSRFSSELRRLPQESSSRLAFPVFPAAAGAVEPIEPESADRLKLLLPAVEAARSGEQGPRARILAELARLIDSADIEALRATWRVLFDRLEPLDEALERVRLELAALLDPDAAELSSGTE